MNLLQTAQINYINAFDPSYPYDIVFTYTDSQAIKNRLVITDNETSSIVYDKIQLGLKLSHTIPGETLVSGKQYIAQIQVFDANGNNSNLSEGLLFYCYSTPTFNLIGISHNELIHKSTLDLILNYSQPENEMLKSYQFFLYGHDHSLISRSDVLYAADSKNYSFHDLKNETSYFVRAIAETNHGIKLDTGQILFNVQFVQIPANIIFEVKNHYKDGYISLFSGIIDIGYDLENENYTIKDGLLTLTNNKLTYNKGFSIESDFILHVEAKRLPLGRDFLQLNYGEISLSIQDICNSYYCCLRGAEISQYAELPKARIVTNDNAYITTADGEVLQIIDTDYKDNDLVVFELQRISGIYGLSAYYKSDVYSEPTVSTS